MRIISFSRSFVPRGIFSGGTESREGPAVLITEFPSSQTSEGRCQVAQGMCLPQIIKQYKHRILDDLRKAHVKNNNNNKLVGSAPQTC